MQLIFIDIKPKEKLKQKKTSINFDYYPIESGQKLNKSFLNFQLLVIIPDFFHMATYDMSYQNIYLMLCFFALN